jgi:hypothetical protein
MEKFARDSESRIRENPEIAVLKGFADYNRATVLTWKDDYASALPLYTRAIAEGGDLDSFYRDRGRAAPRSSLYRESNATEPAPLASQRDDSHSVNRMGMTPIRTALAANREH